MTNKRVLVTGGAGFIGSHTCKALARDGFEPVAYDSLATGHERFVRWGPLERGDIADTARLAEVLERHEPVAVVHFAASAYVGESVAEPLKYYDNNVGGTISLLKAMKARGLSRLVFSSSCATYGIPESVPISEASPQNPINPYGRTKLIAESMLRDLAAAGEIDAVALRYFNAAGSDADGEIGEDHDPETHLIPLVLRAAKEDGGRVTVFGTDYDTPDGTCIRDYIHVSDLAEAHVAALRRLLDGGMTGFNAVNLGTGTGYSVQQIIDGVARVTGREVNAAYGERRAGDPAELVADPSLAASVLDWRPASSDLDTLLGTAWRWMQRT